MGGLLPPKKRKRDSTSYIGPRRQPGRPRKKFPSAAAGFSEVTTPNPKPKQEQYSDSVKKTIKQKKIGSPKLSLLESLPVEILQTIFLESMNVTLPRLSPCLASKLSSEHLQLEMTMQMLYRNHEQAIKDRSQLLACRFFTLEFLAKYIRYASNQWHAAADLDSWNIEKVPNWTEEEALEEFELQHMGYPFLERLKHLYVPEKLLHGPWTEDKRKFLRILKRNDCEIDWNTSSAGEVAKKGVIEAIRADCTSVVQILVGYQDSWVPVSQAMLRCAILQNGCNRDIVRHLFDPLSDVDARPRKELDFMDPTIWAWIERREGDTTAQWLQRVLESNGDSLYSRPPRRRG
jgi:hypothetical protein